MNEPATFQAEWNESHTESQKAYMGVPTLLQTSSCFGLWNSVCLSKEQIFRLTQSCIAYFTNLFFFFFFECLLLGSIALNVRGINMNRNNCCLQKADALWIFCLKADPSRLEKVDLLIFLVLTTGDLLHLSLKFPHAFSLFVYIPLVHFSVAVTVPDSWG